MPALPALTEVRALEEDATEPGGRGGPYWHSDPTLVPVAKGAWIWSDARDLMPTNFPEATNLWPVGAQGPVLTLLEHGQALFGGEVFAICDERLALEERRVAAKTLRERWFASAQAGPWHLQVDARAPWSCVRVALDAVGLGGWVPQPVGWMAARSPFGIGLEMRFNARLHVPSATDKSSTIEIVLAENTFGNIHTPTVSIAGRTLTFPADCLPIHSTTNANLRLANELWSEFDHELDRRAANSASPVLIRTFGAGEIPSAYVLEVLDLLLGHGFVDVRFPDDLIQFELSKPPAALETMMPVRLASESLVPWPVWLVAAAGALASLAVCLWGAGKAPRPATSADRARA